jgi:hypothetical protein
MTEQEVKWIELKAKMQDRFAKVPDLQTLIFLIGVNEVGIDLTQEITKEQKQDLMHVAMCILLSYDGFYEYKFDDEEGWPHFEKVKDFPDLSLMHQENYLKEKIIQYFEEQDA